MAAQPSPEWLHEHISSLLASPHIHFTQPKIPGLQLRMGPGPIDVFSTKFANMFTKDATGVLNGKEVDREGLKEGLLKLQKVYNKDTVQFAPHQAGEGHGIASKLLWKRKDNEGDAEVAVSAAVKHEGGTERIHSLKVDGPTDLFNAQ